MLTYFFSKINLKFILGKCFSGGRNFLGRICIQGRGCGNKRYYRKVNFFRRLNLFGVLCKIIYDSNRTASIVFVLYDNGLSCYNILIEGLSIGSKIYSGYNFSNVNVGNVNIGWSFPFSDMKLFSVVSCVENKPFIGANLIRAASTSVILIGKIEDKAILKLKSGWILYVSVKSFSTYGIVSKNQIFLNDFLKAGKMRAFGFKSKVRGVAKNPCDHPHGGGNGKKSKLTIPVNFLGRFYKWRHTNNTKKERLKRKFFKIN